MSSIADRDDGSIFDELVEDDDKDKAKRESRNKSEKKRRDQFNVLIKELGSMLPGNSRKMDKSTVLQKSIDFLRKHKEISAHSDASEIRQDWKPTFLSNEEFTQLMLEALDGFFLAVMTDGNIIYVSESVTPLLEHLPSDLVDQSVFNFVPEGEHSEVYKILSTRTLESGSLNSDYLKTKNELEFCCHILRGTVDPKEPATYEFVKFIGNFKSLNNVSNSMHNGFDGALQRSLKSTYEERVCFVATVRLATPQFIKEMCTVEEPNEEFTSRHSLEWKFLFLDHRAPPIIGYLPFEVLGTSGYDYYHVDDLENLAKCHEHLMQYGKGKSCYYRFLTKGQQWIWLQTQYYITYHQWNSRPEFIVCTHTVVSYAEVGAERRRELGNEDSPPAMTADKNQDYRSDNHILKDVMERFDDSRTPSPSSKSSIKSSSHTAVSDPSSTPTKVTTDTSTPPRQTLPGPDKRRSSSFSSQSMSSQSATTSSQPIMKPPTMIQLHPGMNQPFSQFTSQYGAMKHLKDQLEQRTRMIEENIHRQQEELRKIQEQLHMVHGQGFQMFLQQPAPGINFGPVQVTTGTAPSIQQLPQLTMQSQVVQTNQLQGTMNTGQLTSQHILQQPLQNTTQQGQQNMHGGHNQQTSLANQTSGTLTSPLYSTMVISQPPTGNMVQMQSSMQQSNQGATVSTFPQDRQIRFSQAQQIVTKLVTTPMGCSAVMVPSTMIMGQVVAAYPQFATQQQPQTLSITQQPQNTQEQQQIPSNHQPGQPHLTQQPQQFLQTSRLVHGNQSAQLILSSFPVQQNTYASSHQQQLSRQRTDSMSDPSKVQQQ
ncbi:circadian locomoter output cycles kaput isoform X1 [Pelobates cultripes]|uniref:Circadian locomoter output cycles protein kaput n=1 Tax=Pelobates cultripes TaxID=61616 RepID=A0AAD1WDI2_PELCU|nr:circadian locomoter output cycles kaput isoform X1 [Pelobates cultripes]